MKYSTSISFFDYVIQCLQIYRTAHICRNTELLGNQISNNIFFVHLKNYRFHLNLANQPRCTLSNLFMAGRSVISLQMGCDLRPVYGILCCQLWECSCTGRAVHVKLNIDVANRCFAKIVKNCYELPTGHHWVSMLECLYSLFSLPEICEQIVIGCFICDGNILCFLFFNI